MPEERPSADQQMEDLLRMARESSDFYEGLARALRPNGSDSILTKPLQNRRVQPEQMVMSFPPGEAVIYG